MDFLAQQRWSSRPTTFLRGLSWRASGAAALCLAAAVNRAVAYEESPSCPCISSFSAAWTAQYIVNVNSTDWQLLPAEVQNTADARDHYYPANYGLDECENWDEDLPPWCRNADGTTRLNTPSWCVQAWCYVDPALCAEGDATVSLRDSVDGAPYYSYATCGVSDDYWAKYARTQAMNASDIRGQVVTYLREIREHVEDTMVLLNDEEGGSIVDCSFSDGCDCSGCVEGTGEWRSADGSPGYEVDFGSMSVTHRGGLFQTNTWEEQRAECLSSYVEAEYKRIARLEYNDPGRQGFVYYGEQKEGLYFGWPGVTLCDNYDPRFRPWYVSAVSGPKDVVIVLDRSGSMQTASRWELALDAVHAVLRTLNEYDYVGLVLFSTTAEAFESTMISATSENKERIFEWASDNSPIGSTDFGRGFVLGFQVLETSRSCPSSAPCSSECNSMVLFLTDGEDTSGIEIETITSYNTVNAVVFTYTFGSGATDEKPRQIACSNNGIYYHITDGGDLSNAMASYYSYFATHAAASDSGQVRWSSYLEVTTDHEVITGCLPAYDRSRTNEELQDLHGVTCFDVGLIVTTSEFKLKPDFAAAWDQMQSETRACYLVSHSPEAQDLLRRRVSDFSTCDYNKQANPASRAEAMFPGMVCASLLVLASAMAAALF